MTVRFVTDVDDYPATVLLPARLSLSHWCTTCRQWVKTDDLLAHARVHITESPREGDAIE